MGCVERAGEECVLARGKCESKANEQSKAFDHIRSLESSLFSRRALLPVSSRRCQPLCQMEECANCSASVDGDDDRPGPSARQGPLSALSINGVVVATSPPRPPPLLPPPPASAREFLLSRPRGAYTALSISSSGCAQFWQEHCERLAATLVILSEGEREGEREERAGEREEQLPPFPLFREWHASSERAVPLPLASLVGEALLPGVRAAVASVRERKKRRSLLLLLRRRRERQREKKKKTLLPLLRPRSAPAGGQCTSSCSSAIPSPKERMRCPRGSGSTRRACPWTLPSSPGRVALRRLPRLLLLPPLTPAPLLPSPSSPWPPSSAGLARGHTPRTASGRERGAPSSGSWQRPSSPPPAPPGTRRLAGARAAGASAPPASSA